MFWPHELTKSDKHLEIKLLPGVDIHNITYVWKLRDDDTAGIFEERVRTRAALVEKKRTSVEVWRNFKECLTNSVVNQKPMQIRKDRCDVAEPRFLCDNSSKSILDML